MYSVQLRDLVTQFNLKSLTPEVDDSGIMLGQADVNRPALQMAGFFDYFESERLQIIGKVEHTYLSRLEQSIREEILAKLFSFKIPCLVICRSLPVFPEMLVYAKQYNVPVYEAADSTSDFMGEVIRWLKVELAPRVTVHGVFVDIYGEGVLIMGESGVGKSEAALELIKRGHRLVADDAVEIRKVSHRTLYGTCPEIIRHLIELRGIGIIDVKQMFGVGSVKQTQTVDLVIKLELWDSAKEYDRMGLHEEYVDILGNNLVCLSIPIRPGRNLAVICESAAINHRQKKMGYNAAQELNDRVMKSISKSGV